MRSVQILGTLTLTAICVCCVIILACDGSGGAALLRSGVFPNIPFVPGLEGGGIQGGGGAVGGGGDNTNDGGGDNTNDGGMLATEGTMTVTFVNNATVNAQVALWASEDIGASTDLVQTDANLAPIGPEGAQSFVPILRPNDRIAATLNCVDARSISVAVAENLVLITPQSCVSPPLRQGEDFDCNATDVVDFIVLIRDGPGNVLEIIAGSRIYQGCSN